MCLNTNNPSSAPVAVTSPPLPVVFSSLHGGRGTSFYSQARASQQNILCHHQPTRSLNTRSCARASPKPHGALRDFYFLNHGLEYLFLVWIDWNDLKQKANGGLFCSSGTGLATPGHRPVIRARLQLIIAQDTGRYSCTRIDYFGLLWHTVCDCNTP